MKSEGTPEDVQGEPRLPAVGMRDRASAYLERAGRMFDTGDISAGLRTQTIRLLFLCLGLPLAAVSIEALFSLWAPNNTLPFVLITAAFFAVLLVITFASVWGDERYDYEPATGEDMGRAVGLVLPLSRTLPSPDVVEHLIALGEPEEGQPDARLLALRGLRLGIAGDVPVGNTPARSLGWVEKLVNTLLFHRGRLERVVLLCTEAHDEAPNSMEHVQAVRRLVKVLGGPTLAAVSVVDGVDSTDPESMRRHTSGELRKLVHDFDVPAPEVFVDLTAGTSIMTLGLALAAQERGVGFQHYTMSAVGELPEAGWVETPRRVSIDAVSVRRRPKVRLTSY